MGYSGARGGLEAILAAEDLARRSRDHASAPWVSTGQITARFRLAVDRVMGEAGLYKAIAMANLDIACRRFGRSGPLEQLLLLTTDGLDAGGFLEHLKLPHYVTFRSMVERKQAMRDSAAQRQRRTEPVGRDCRCPHPPPRWPSQHCWPN